MKAIVQRVSRAHVVIAGEIVGCIERGLVVLFCAERGDTPRQVDKLLTKILKLRIFSDQAVSTPHAAVNQGAAMPSAKMNWSVQDVQGGLLLISQFTLAADLSGGHRPSFSGAAPPDEGRRLYDYLVQQAGVQHAQVAAGQFGADMQVHLVNDGPVTIALEL